VAEGELIGHSRIANFQISYKHAAHSDRTVSSNSQRQARRPRG